MRSRTLAAAAVATALLAGAGGVALAQGEPRSERPKPGAVLEGLVERGVLTSDQAQAVREAFREARGDRGPRPGFHKPGMRPGGPMGHFRGILGVAARTIGIEPQALASALREGQSIAQVAAANGSSGQAVVDAAIAELGARLDERVAAGKLDAAKAAEMKAKASEKLTEMVDRTFPVRPRD